MWIDFSYFYSFRWDSHKIGGLNFASKATQKPSIFGSKIIYFQNQSLSYSSSINHKARCIKSCWPCIDCSFCSPPINRFWVRYVPTVFQRMQNFSASGCTHRTAFCNHRHRPKTLPRRVLCPNEKRIKQWTRWGDNRSSKILFGKRKYYPLQFLRIRKPPSKLFERIFCRMKTKKNTSFKKLPL